MNHSLETSSFSMADETPSSLALHFPKMFLKIIWIILSRSHIYVPSTEKPFLRA
uniref:Uncharacterized protein n=1 Tax=Anguilla anguilla TaxID=7936 RepID=A0A0E9U1C4_ANGAN